MMSKVCSISSMHEIDILEEVGWSININKEEDALEAYIK